jgi:aminoglycoside phosphotransferase (APT) family kinase protein
MSEVEMGKELDPEVVRAKLKVWFQSKMPRARELSISPFKMAGNGLSNQTYFLDVEWQEGGKSKFERMVIRWAPKSPYRLYYKYDMKEQFLLMKHLESTDVPVPRARWLEEDESAIGSTFYIVDRVEGWVPSESPPYRVSGPIFEGTPEYRAMIWWEAVDMMARINTLDWEKAGLGFLGVPRAGTTEPLDHEIAFYEKLSMMGGEPHPILKATTDWLKKNRFVPKHISLLWGDPRIGNIVYRNDEIAAVLDWELARLGDPESDLAWFLYTENIISKSSPPLEGLPNDDEVVKHYEQVTHRKVENLFYHDIMATWRFAIIVSRAELSLKAKGYSKPGVAIDRVRDSREKLKALLNL